MTRLVQDMAMLLRAGGYTVTHQSSMPSAVSFEDRCVVGFGAEFDTVDALIDGWKAFQDNCLRAHASALRRNPTKAWNLYTVVISPEEGTALQRRELAAIEEDFVSTRKIARASVVGRTELHDAILPLLPIRAATASQSESVEESLKRKLDPVEQSLLDVFLSDSFEVSAVISTLQR